MAGGPPKQLGKTGVTIVRMRLADGTTCKYLYAVAAPPEPMPIISTIIRAFETSPEWG